MYCCQSEWKIKPKTSETSILNRFLKTGARFLEEQKYREKKILKAYNTTGTNFVR